MNLCNINNNQILRASRAYCLGVRRQELDRSIAECETSRIHHLFKKRVELIQTDIYTEKLNKIGSDVMCNNIYAKNYPFFMKEIVH